MRGPWEAVRRWWGAPFSDVEERHGIGGGRHEAFEGRVMIPLGIFFYITGMDSLALWHNDGFLELVMSFALVAMVLLSALAYAWHLMSYGLPPEGLIEGGPRSALKSAGVAALVLSWLLILYGAAVSDLLWSFPVSTMGLWFAASLFAWYHANRRLCRHYAVMAALVLVTSFLPVLGVAASRDLYASPAVFSFTLGSILVVGGLLDLKVLAILTRPVGSPFD